MKRKKMLMISPALIAFVSLLLISGFSLSAFIGSLVMGFAFFALALGFLTEKNEVIEEMNAEEVEEVKVDKVKID